MSLTHAMRDESSYPNALCGARHYSDRVTTAVECVDCVVCEQILEEEAREMAALEAEAQRVAVGFGMLRTWE